jgi:putative acyl-CoA dehydrogenase
VTTTFSTHEVFNQSPSFDDVNLFALDPVALSAAAAQPAAFASLSKFGRVCGSAHALELGRIANESTPRLKAFDQKGRRLDIVEFHPAYHELMAISMEQGLHCSAFEHVLEPGAAPRSGASLVRAIGVYLAAQMEAGHGCPITMTNAAVPTLLTQRDVTEPWLAKIMSRSYDKRFLPMEQKTSVTIGMGMTEKQGGTDVRANTTRATAIGREGGGAAYRIVGHKWFMSAPMCDAFLILAQTERGPTCFLVPRLLPGGAVNELRFQRLKEKLGNRSNASSEVEFQGATGWAIGEPGRGVATIIEMVTCTRLDCAVASAGHMRMALTAALHHARHRTVFQRKLVDQPLMTRVLADLAVEWEAAARLAFRLARSFDAGNGEPGAAWRRVMTPVVKYWICKSAPAFVYEAMECLGGNGYVEDGVLARLYREAPLNAIWEGSGNVMALDLLRVVQREPEAIRAVLDDIAREIAGELRLESMLDDLLGMLKTPSDLEANARAVAEDLAVLDASATLRPEAPGEVTEAFVRARVAGRGRRLLGSATAPDRANAILERAPWPLDEPAGNTLERHAIPPRQAGSRRYCAAVRRRGALFASRGSHLRGCASSARDDTCCRRKSQRSSPPSIWRRSRTS